MYEHSTNVHSGSYIKQMPLGHLSYIKETLWSSTTRYTTVLSLLCKSYSSIDYLCNVRTDLRGQYVLSSPDVLDIWKHDVIVSHRTFIPNRNIYLVRHTGCH